MRISFELSHIEIRLPGRLTISVCFRIPAAALLRTAYGVTLRDSTIIAVVMPFVSLSSICLVASGVMSLGAKPVPPLQD